MYLRFSFIHSFKNLSIMTTKKKEAIRLLRIVKKEFKKIHDKAWKGNAITVGQSNDAIALLTFTFGAIEDLISYPLTPKS